MNYIKLLSFALALFLFNSVNAQDFDLRTTQSGHDIIVEIIYTGSGSVPTTADFLLDLNFELQGTDLNMSFGAINNTAGWGVNTQGSQSTSGGFVRQTYGLSNAPINFPTDLSSTVYTEIARITTDAAPGSVISVGESGTHPTNPGIPFLNVNGLDFTPSVTAGAALPLDLTTFSVGKHDAISSLLKWTTEMEEDFSHFTVERSLDGVNWRPVADIKATGNQGIQTSDYQFVDRQIPFASEAISTVYYRLKMIDLNGKFEWSKVESVEFENRVQDVQVYPNPTADWITIQSKSDITELIVFDIDGKIVLQRPYTGPVDMSSFNAGMYKLFIKTTTGTITKTVVKID